MSEQVRVDLPTIFQFPGLGKRPCKQSLIRMGSMGIHMTVFIATNLINILRITAGCVIMYIAVGALLKDSSQGSYLWTIGMKAFYIFCLLAEMISRSDQTSIDVSRLQASCFREKHE